jgi:ABC-type protease/lipase transport system fused ATPase/permease subunit
MIQKYPLSAVFAAIFSVFILTSFPLITQFYIKYLFNQTLQLLVVFTLIFALVFIFKIFIDIFVEKVNLKYDLKLEKNIKERVYEKYKSNISRLLKDKSDIIATHIYLFLLYVRTKRDNLFDIAKILIVTVIIFFFNSHLFYYLLYSLPFLALFWVISKKLLLSQTSERKTEDFSVVLSRASSLSGDQARKEVMSHLEAMYRKKKFNRSRIIPLKMSMRSFISFFRIFYLAYFGYFFLISYLDLAGLIVGLLYITIFIRPCLHLIESAHIYEISKTSRRKIYALYS